MTVDLDDTAVDHGVFEVGIFGQHPEHTIKCVGLHPSAKPFEDRVPLPEILGQIAPRAAGARDPENGIEKKARIRPGATGITFPTKTVRGDGFPLGVCQSGADQGCLPFGNLESLSD